MDNAMFKYFTERYKNQLSELKTQGQTGHDPGPVITISREYGCQGKEFSDVLKKKLDTIDPLWRIISKEVLDDSARELKMDSRQLEYVFKGERMSTIEEILNAMSSRYYKSDERIHRTIRKVIYQFGKKGYSIILGRCGVCITQDIENSLHLKLEADKPYRLNNIMKWRNLSREDAEKEMEQTDRNREWLMNRFSKNKFNPRQFDLRINTERFSINEAVDIVVQAAKQKQLV
ncbi:MAG: cytidylate kinase-like family protein [Bacteroidales bacterium]|nr:cytidylate kinase-like family protein [Bacteroidales bacterium]